LVALLSISFKSDNDVKKMLCHKWLQVASKQHDNASQRATDKSMAKNVTFKPDGTYEEVTYNNTLKIEGEWFLNPEQTKMEFTVTNLNGQKMPPFPETTRHYNIIILKLTADTLVYGREAYYGNKQVYGHDDLYFVRQE